MPSASIHVHKFGGTSLADAARIRALGALLDDGAGSRLVVVSAMHGTTNALVELAATARNGGDWLPAWEALRQRHLQAADALGSNGPHPGAAIAGDFDALHADAAMLATRPVDADRIEARIHGYGEVWSSRLVQAGLGGEAAGWQRQAVTSTAAPSAHPYRGGYLPASRFARP